MSEETTIKVGRLTEKQWFKNLPAQIRERVLRSMKELLPEGRHLLKWDENRVHVAASSSDAAPNASATGRQAPSVPAKSNPATPKAESKSPAGKAMHLTAQHFAVGDKITTKSGKSGVITHG
jgi:hypothetical protein